jgi:hypothetical protein
VQCIPSPLQVKAKGHCSHSHIMYLLVIINIETSGQITVARLFAELLDFYDSYNKFRQIVHTQMLF